MRNNERLSLVNTKLPIKKLANCTPYFTALQFSSKLETQTSPKTTSNLENLNFLKKSIERFKNYSLIS